MKMRVVELFSGIGAQARALEKLASNKKIKFKIVGTCEWNIHAILAYDLIHNRSRKLPKKIDTLTKDEVFLELSKFTLSNDGSKPISYRYLKSLDEEILKKLLYSIKRNNNMVDINDVKGSDLPCDLDILTYSFPCQDLSSVGSLHGYNKGIDKDESTRSGLLWEVERILKERKKLDLNLPKFLLLENVTTLEANRHRGNFNKWKKTLTDLGYTNRVYKLNSINFGIPQHRNRLIMLSVLTNNNPLIEEYIKNYFLENDLNNHSIKLKKLNSFLKLDYTNHKYLEEALQSQPNDTPSRKKIWDNNQKIINEDGIVAEKVQTITTKQDRHPNSGNIYFNQNNGKSNFRFLTPRECFLLMGYKERDIDVLLKNNPQTRKNSKFFSRDTLYKLAGNSIVVNVLEEVFKQVIDINKIILNISNE